MRRIVLLLSATIHCEDTPFLQRRNPDSREADYRWAMRGWLDAEGCDTVIFCENSGADLSKLESYARSINSRKHELIFLSCEKNAGAAGRGKGYGEMEIIRYAMDSLHLIAPDQLIVKVTGRYRSRNATKLFSLLRELDGEIFCNMRRNLTLSDSSVFAISAECARERLLPLQERVNDNEGRWFEHVLAEAALGTVLAGGRWSPLPCDPSIHGFSGTLGVKVGYSPIERIRSGIRHFLSRRIFSGF